MMRAATLLALFPLAFAAPAKRATRAPLLKARDSTVIEGKYIVKLSDSISIASESDTISAAVKSADFTYSNAFQGFAGSLTDDEVEALQDDPSVEYIEQDAVITISTTVTQTDATWGIARISSEDSGSTTYTYDDSAGEGVCAYVIDTGIYTSHSDFGGRASFLANYVDDDDTDGNGHGTHVAGTIGSTTYGVAKEVTLFAVKVLDSSGSGTTSGVIAGMDFVVSDSATRSGCSNGFVSNMSLGGSRSTALNTAAASIVDAGIFLGVAAGNDEEDASNTSPASESSVCTVGATTSSDGFAYYSNYGSVVDILAPGSSITSTYNTGGTAVLSGTSMATPHVVGLAAYFLALGQSVDGLCAYIASVALEDVISDVPSGTVNLLIHNDQ